MPGQRKIRHPVGDSSPKTRSHLDLRRPPVLPALRPATGSGKHRSLRLFRRRSGHGGRKKPASRSASLWCFWNHHSPEHHLRGPRDSPSPTNPLQAPRIYPKIHQPAKVFWAELSRLHHGPRYLVPEPLQPQDPVIRRVSVTEFFCWNCRDIGPKSPRISTGAWQIRSGTVRCAHAEHPG